MEKNKKEDVKDMEIQELIKILIEKIGDNIPKDDNSEKTKEIKINKAKKRYKDYLQVLNDEYKTRIKIENEKTPVLLDLFTQYVESIYKQSEIYKIALTTYCKIEDILLRDFSDKQKNLFEQMIYCKDKMLDDGIEQAFIYGYAIACQMKNEAIQKYPLKKE